MNQMEMQIAVQSIHSIPQDKPLEERVAYAMRFVREHESSVFWMHARVNDDVMLRTALAAVMIAGNEEDKDIITRSMMPLRMLSAAASGIPVDFSAMETEGLLPLMKLWRESGEKA